MRYWAVALVLGLAACGGEKTKIVYVDRPSAGEGGESSSVDGEDGGTGSVSRGGNVSMGAGGSFGGAGTGGGAGLAGSGSSGSGGVGASGAGSGGSGGVSSGAAGVAEAGAGGEPSEIDSCEVPTQFATDCTTSCGWSETAERAVGDSADGCAADGLGESGVGVCCSACYSAPPASMTTLIPAGTCPLPEVDDLRFCPASDWHVIVQPQTCVKAEAAGTFVACDGALEVLSQGTGCIVVRNLNAERKTFGVNRANLRATLATQVDVGCALTCP